MPVEFLISALVTLLVVVDPVGLVPAFLAVTQERADARTGAFRRQVALRACLIAGAILIGAATPSPRPSCWLARPPIARPGSGCCSRSSSW
jgi:small neutral amino acid transporter SnatA (MarC family)